MRAAIIWMFSAVAAVAQPVEFDPDDFGKIVLAPKQSAGGNGFQLEQAFGDYQNEPVITYGENSAARKLGRPVGRLDTLYSNGKTGYCTAFVVDEKHIVTNNHCIPGVGGVKVQAAQFVAGYVEPGRSAGAERFNVQIAPIETNKSLDYSVLRVFGDPSAKYGTVKLAGADAQDDEFLWIIGHPQGQSQHISREGCAATAPAISPEGKLVHSCDTLGGNSGSPVFRLTDRHVVGLHHAGDNRTGFNFAIPMSRILEDSQVLQAAVAPAPKVVEKQPEDSCQILWNQAEKFGCVGFDTFLAQCASHPLAPLATGLREAQCVSDSAPVDTAKVDKGDQTAVPKSDPAKSPSSADPEAWRVEIEKGAQMASEKAATHLKDSKSLLFTMTQVGQRANTLKAKTSGPESLHWSTVWASWNESKKTMTVLTRLERDLQDMVARVPDLTNQDEADKAEQALRLQLKKVRLAAKTIRDKRAEQIASLQQAEKLQRSRMAAEITGPNSKYPGVDTKLVYKTVTYKDDGTVKETAEDTVLFLTSNAHSVSTLECTDNTDCTIMNRFDLFKSQSAITLTDKQRDLVLAGKLLSSRISDQATAVVTNQKGPKILPLQAIHKSEWIERWTTPDSEFQIKYTFDARCCTISPSKLAKTNKLTRMTLRLDYPDRGFYLDFKLDYDPDLKWYVSYKWKTVQTSGGTETVLVSSESVLIDILDP